MTEKTVNNVATGLILAGAALVLPTALKHAKEALGGEGLPIDALKHIPDLLSGDTDNKDGQHNKLQEHHESQTRKHHDEQQPKKVYDEHGKEILLEEILKQHQS